MAGETIEFGKHKGKKLSDPDVPDSYIQWLVEMRRKDLEMYEGELKRRAMAAEAAENASLSMTEKLIYAGYKALAMKMHPDKGGTTKEFQELSGSYEQLKAIMGEVKK